jgi:hypothetical protein
VIDLMLKGVRPNAVLVNRMKEQFELENLDTITTRINRIRERKHLIEKFGISPANEEAFLAICQRFEGSFTDTSSDEMLRKISPKGENTDWNSGYKSKKLYWEQFYDFAQDCRIQRES